MRSHWYGVTASLVGLTLTAALLLTLAGPSEARPTAPTPTPGPVAGYMDHLPLITNGAFLGKSNLPAQGDLRDYTSYQVMNLAKSPGAIAHIRVDYYTSNGVLVYSAILPDLAPLTAQTVAQKTEAGLPEGVYSAVLTSDQPITALVTEALGDPAVPGPTMSAPLSMYEGVTLGSSSLALPALESNWFDTDSLVRVQNIGGGPATVTVQYEAAWVGGVRAGQVNIPPMTYTLPRYAAVTIDQAVLGATLAALSGPYAGRFLGGALITSDQPLAAIVNEVNLASRRRAAYTALGEFEQGTALFAPLALAGSDLGDTAMQVMNTHLDRSLDVTIEYTAGAGSRLLDGSNGEATTHTVSFPLGPGEVMLRDESVAGLGDLRSVFSRFQGTARIASSQGNLAARVLQTQGPNAVGQRPMGAYTPAVERYMSSEAFAPLIQAGFGSNATVLTCGNASSQPAEVVVEYTSGAASTVPYVSAQYRHVIPPRSHIIIDERVLNNPAADIHRTTSPWYRDGRPLRFSGSAWLFAAQRRIACVVGDYADSLAYDNLGVYTTWPGQALYDDYRVFAPLFEHAGRLR